MNSTAMTIEISDLEYAWPNQGPLLQLKSFTVAAGESLCLLGPSGTGKSTLLSLIAGVLEPQKGHLKVCGSALEALSSHQRDQLRADHIGIIFQMFNLVPYLSVLQNVLLPCRFSPRRRNRFESPESMVEDAKRLLCQLGLDAPDLLSRPVRDLSVGQQQRVAAARAMIGAPELIIADEPTSALDRDNRNRFVRLLQDEAKASGATLLFVTHDQGLASQFDSTVTLDDINHITTPTGTA
ncbi:MAG: ABC transporter ATP-binding protein [Henriciella sp.]